MSRMSGRFWIALLLLLNAVTLAWQWNAFARWGLGPESAREPERFNLQIRPDAIRIETPAAATERIAAEALQAADVENAEPAEATERSQQGAAKGVSAGTAKPAAGTSAAPSPASTSVLPSVLPSVPTSASSPAPSSASTSLAPPARARKVPPPSPNTSGDGPRATPDTP